jgi:hypothetical protein
MTIPSVVVTYPADADTGIPIGITLKVYFDRGVDLETVKNGIVLYGADSDRSSGPDSALWADRDTGENPWYLRSPGFKGLVPLNYELAYYTLGTTTEVDPGTITSEADEVAASVGHVVKVTPRIGQLGASLLHNFVVLGDPTSLSNGISKRTVFDVEAGVGNTGTTGDLVIFGTWTGTVDDKIYVKITTAGDIGTAKYKWWYDSLGEASAVTGRKTNRKYRTLDDGLQIRFTGSGFVVDDSYSFNLEPKEFLAANYSVSFTTNDGSYSTAPDSPSTPASSSPPASVLPTNAEDPFDVSYMVPTDGSYNVSKNIREIVVVFNQDVDASTITDTTVKLWNYPISGHYEDTYEPYELEKTLSLNGDTLTITF